MNVTGRMRRLVTFTRAGAATVCAVMLAASAACAPRGTAVGDTQGREPSPVEHVGTVRDDALIGLVGSVQATADSAVLDALADASIETVYRSVKDGGEAGAAARGQQGVRDMVSRVVSLVVISDLDVSTDVQGWDDALRDAREAGIPVALLDPVHAPDDETLYAATLVLNDRDAEATPIDDAAMTVLNDLPHDREITVTTVR
ncbi:hypothetical protein [Bifidobacterium aesculapii]|uniref:hypothetical protein n=1 Tax=Bifidobacterium aesculapii TaxID=1329411 RepID=UPI0006E2F792|nr:hypothetical protein [Bifidobacterium aesculapii]